ncbi:MAG: HNH endonuclease family protein, partial [Bacteroidetes bacterium]|nr:HNH endonuclease family protein [Bacteroidota bacterium]
LTLTAYNPELSNKSFAEKKQWYTNSNLELNKYFRNVDTWDEAAIDARAEHLSNLAMHIWKR